MSYIGKTPTPAPLTSSDITNGIVTGEKLNADVISSQTELATAPADTDEFLISDAGVLKRLDASLIGGGIVLQVVNGTNNTNTTTTNTSYTDTSITASITPSSTSNKILVFASVNGAGNVTASKQSYFSLYRDTTARIEWFSISGAAYNYNANSIGFLDSPSSTSALSYNIKIKSESGGTAIVGAYNSYSSLVLMEIKV